MIIKKYLLILNIIFVLLLFNADDIYYTIVHLKFSPNLITNNIIGFRLIRTPELRFLPVSFDRLFPLDAFRKELEENDIEVEFDIRGEITEDKINLVLYNKDTILAKIKLNKRNSLAFVVEGLPPQLPVELQQILINENTKIIYETDSRLSRHQQKPGISKELAFKPRERMILYGTSFMRVKYENLNWFAKIEHFLIVGFYRRIGIGAKWYQEHIKPYLKESGFNIVTVLGSCMELSEVRSFWQKMGFSSPIILNDLRGESEEVQEFIVFKEIEK